MAKSDFTEWFFAVSVIPLVALGILASLALIVSGFVGFFFGSAETSPPTKSEAKAAEQRALTILKDAIEEHPTKPERRRWFKQFPWNRDHAA